MKIWHDYIFGIRRKDDSFIKMINFIGKAILYLKVRLGK